MLDSPLLSAGRLGRTRAKARGTHAFRAGAASLFLAAFLGLPAAQGIADEKLPLPRFASLKSDEVNLRSGPGEDKPKLWVYQRSGMPVEIIDEFDTWRQIRDYKGAVGWVSASLLSGKRTAIVTESRRILHARADAASPAVAELDPGVIGKLTACDGAWCRLDVKGYQGWLLRTDLWGVFPNEVVKD
jgi:SH3-like domain-containing protein